MTAYIVENELHINSDSEVHISVSIPDVPNPDHQGNDVSSVQPSVYQVRDL